MPPKLSVTFPSIVLLLLAKARQVRTSMSDNRYFAGPWHENASSVAELSEAIDQTQKACDEALTRDTAKIAFRDQCQKRLVAILKKIAQYAELVADGNIDILKSTGFDLQQQKGRAKTYGLLEAPVVTLKHGPVGGTLIARAKPINGAASYEAHIADSDPTVDENWKQYGVFAHCSHIDITGLTPGQNYFLRLRCIGAAGTGAWSAPCTLMSL